MTFFQAINTCFSKYTIFSGRAKRSEYWYWRLFELFLALLAFRLDMIFFSNSETGSISLFVFFFTCIPGIAVSVRRLHDISKSGWWLLITFTGVGNFLLLYWFLLPSDIDQEKKCAWCDTENIIFKFGIKGNWYWQYRNTDGSQDKRVKDNFQQANFTSEYLCENCGAVTKFIHFANKEPGENVKVSERLLKSDGKGDRKGSDWKSSSGVNVDTSSANRKSK